MIAIIYPKNDWTAADTAVKIQAIAASKQLKVFITPKHSLRDNETLAQKLRQTNYAILLMFDTTTLDSETLWELNTLLDKQARVYAIVPSTYKINGKRIEFIPYNKNSRMDLEQQIKKVLEHIKKWESAFKKVRTVSSEDAGLMILVMTGVLLLMLSAVALSKSK